MPYIDTNDRKRLDPHIDILARGVLTPGELNYIISRLLVLSAGQSQRPSYHDMSAWRAAVTDAAEEYYRRVMAPYEDRKMEINGDVYRK